MEKFAAYDRSKDHLKTLHQIVVWHDIWTNLLRNAMLLSGYRRLWHFYPNSSSKELRPADMTILPSILFL